MKILAIETSCDETAVSVVEASGGFTRPRFKVLAHIISSQIKLHAPYGGVVPSLAKREHSKNLMPLVAQAIHEADLVRRQTSNKLSKTLTIEKIDQIRQILEREPELLNALLKTIPDLPVPAIDLIAVTRGPGLEPALWVGINGARALGLAWNLRVIPINHMEGHVLSPLVTSKTSIKFPSLALLISGGHTELVLSKDWLKYQVIGQTRDDAVGEAFDKVARILGLPYPGGPEISKLASLATPSVKNPQHSVLPVALPRPMIDSPDCDFSFSGLKTAVLYLVKKMEPLSQIDRIEIAAEFQQAVVDVLVKKTSRALDKFKPKTLIIGGGVIANSALRAAFTTLIKEKYPKVSLLIPEMALTTDNATMIATAAYFHTLGKKKLTTPTNIIAKGTLPLS